MKNYKKAAIIVACVLMLICIALAYNDKYGFEKKAGFSSSIHITSMQ